MEIGLLSSEVFMEVFCLFYEYYESSRPDLDVEKIIGFYSSYDNALAGLIRNKSHPEFCKNPECLMIARLKLDSDNAWLEGF